MSFDMTGSHLAKLGLRSNGMRKCPHKRCAGTYEEWLTPDGYKRALDPSTLLPHDLTCAWLQKSPARPLGTVLGTILMSFGFMFLAFVMVGVMGFDKILGGLGKGGLMLVAVGCCVAAYRAIREANKEAEAEALRQPSRTLDYWFAELRGIEQRQRKRDGQPQGERG